MIVQAIVAAAVLASSAAAQNPPRAGEAAFRDLYKQLVETDTTLSAGSCTLAAQQVATRLKAAGFADADLHLFSLPEAPKEGGLVAVLPGKDAKAKAILLIAHLDVVEAKRADWARDPFKLVEEGGYFYARGASDDKAMAAIFADSLIRMRAEGVPRRTVKLALTCGEETTGVFNGAEWLAANRRDLIDAAFALNEGGGGRVDADGKPRSLALQVGEKTAHNYTLEARNRGGHSSVPRIDNAVTSLAIAVLKIQAYKFPVQMTPVTQAFFARAAPLYAAPVGPAMAAIAAKPGDVAAEAVLAQDPLLNSTLRTTCVVTLLEAGHAENALAQRARGNVNCRIFPGDTIEGTQAALAAVIADPGVTITSKPRRGPTGTPTPLDPRVVAPAEKLATTMFPGVPLIPTMSTGATDSIYLAAAGIPSYGVPGILRDEDGGGVHGLDERIRVKSVLDGRDYLHRLVRIYAEAK